METHQHLLSILRKGYRRFRNRRLVEAASLGASVLFPALLGVLALGLLIEGGRLGAWLVPILVAIAVVAALVRAIRYGLQNHLSFGSFLLKVEQRAKLSRNELMNALQLGRRIPKMNDPLAREVATEVLRRGADTARKIPFGALAPIRSLRGPNTQVAAAIVVLVALFLLAPGAMMRTATQILHPGQVPEVAGIEILVDPGDCTAERGSSLPVQARVVGIEGEPTLFHRAGGGAWQRQTMQVEEGSFTGMLADLQAETEYAVAVGGTRSRTYRVLLEEPLRALGYEKWTRYPDYTRLAPEKELSPHGSIAALTGSEVELLVSLSRPDVEGQLIFESGERIPLVSSGEAVASAQIEVRESDTYHVELTRPAVHGSEWRSERFFVDPILDRNPSLYLLAPGEQVDLPPEMRIVLEVDCADDFGIRRLDLVWRRNEGNPTRTTITRWNRETEARVAYPWLLDEIAMAPGDRILYRLELTDNDTVSGPKTTRSPEYMIRFPSIEELYAQQEQERRAGMEEIQDSLDRQIDLREQLKQIAQEMRQEGGVEWEQKQEVEEFLEHQEEVLQKMEQLAEAMDQQLDRMQQGELFSPEILAKIAQIQEMVRQIQSPEFHDQMQALRQAMQSLDPEEVRKALEKMEMTQKEIEQGLDRTLRMLEKLLAEEKLDELIQRAERLAEEQDRINQELSEDSAGKADSTSALSEEEAEALRQQQEAAQRELSELQKQMEQLKEMAERSHQEMSQELSSQEGEQSQESLDGASQEMQQSQQAMSQQNRQKSRKSGKKASSNLRAFASQMRQMQQELEADMTEELSRRLMVLAGSLVSMSKQQEEVIASSGQQNTRDLAAGEERLERATGHVVNQIYELARETPFITPSQARALGELMNRLSEATNTFEIGRRSAGVTLSRQAETMMDEMVASLLESNESMCNSSSSSSCNKPNPGGAMSSLSQQQQGVNQGTQQLFGEMQGSRLQQGAGERLQQLAAQQEQIRAGLREVAGSLGNGQNMLGRLDEMADEMEEIVKEMRDKNVDERLLRRQEKILSRLLTAQRSLRRQDYEEQRRSRAGINPGERASPDAVEPGLSRREQIRRGILKGSQDPIPGDFRRLVDEYFRALMESSR